MENKINPQALRKTYQLLKYTFGIVPIVAGADKFTNLLTQWDQYLHPGMVKLLPFSAPTFMMVVGIIEIVAGIVVIKKTELGGYIVAAWLVLIAFNLLFSLNYLDVAVRDLVMAIAAYSMAKISKMLAA